MNAPELLATLRGRGVIVARDGDALELDAPKGALADLLPELQKFKPALLELLESPESSRAPAISPEAPATDFWRDVSKAIQDARRGRHLAYTPALAWAWQGANAVSGRDLTSVELCALATKNTQGDSK